MIDSSIILFNKSYSGFEDLYDIQRDVSEAFQIQYNHKLRRIPSEFSGDIMVTITYVPSEHDFKIIDVL
jgi:hypothetical protein